MTYTLNFDLEPRRFEFYVKNVKSKNDTNLFCLLDTGAFIPVWCSSVSILLNIYPNARFSGYITKISGFGHGVEFAPLYIIPKFILSDGPNRVVYDNLPIALLQKDYDYHMILSYTMFTTANMTFKNFISKQTGQIEKIKPKLLLNFPNDELRVAANYGMVLGQQAKQAAQKYGAKGLITNISIFSQK